MPKILITGSEGFIGKHLCKLLEKDNEILRYDRKIKLLPLSCFFIEKPDYVVHLASNISDDIEKCREDIDLTFKILELSLKYNIKKVIFASSAAVYGNSYPYINPISPYGISKLQCEEWIDYYVKKGLNCVILRLSNVYGKGGNGVINQFINKISKNEKLIVNNTGNQKRDYIHVFDVIGIISKIINSNIDNRNYNVSTGEGNSIWTILKILRDLQNNDINIELGSLKEEIVDSVLENYEIKTDLNYDNFIKLKEGIEMFYKNE